MFTVHVRVTDSSTGKPTPVRMRLRDGQGVYHAPLGRLTTFALGEGEDVGGHLRLCGQNWAYVEGNCEVKLPSGRVLVEMGKGPEYSPICQEITLVEGKLALRFSIDRWIDLRQERWYAGDIRAHDLSPHAALLEGAAEGLALVHLLARERPACADRPGSVSNLLAFSGTEAALASAECLVAVNTLNEHPVLGSVGLLHSHRPVFPLRSGEEGKATDWSVADWCDQCHRKKGLVVWADRGRFGDPPQGEALAALILGKMDAFEVRAFPEPEPEELRWYYDLLDLGLRPTLVGGSGKDRNTIPLGSVRTYAQLAPGEELSCDSWVHAVRKGRTFVTNGPLLLFGAGEVGPGGVIQARTGQVVHFRVEAQSTLPFDQLDLISGGEMLASKFASGNRQSTILEADLVVQESSWVAARCLGRERLPTDSYLFAHTTPIWIEVADRPLVPREEKKTRVEALLAQTVNWARTATWSNDKQHQQLLDLVEQARKELTRRTQSHRTQ